MRKRDILLQHIKQMAGSETGYGLLDLYLDCYYSLFGVKRKDVSSAAQCDALDFYRCCGLHFFFDEDFC